MITDLKLGRNIVLQGLTTRPELNEERAVIVASSLPSERVGVRVVSSGERISVRHASIRSAALPTPPAGMERTERLKWILADIQQRKDELVAEGVDVESMKQVLTKQLETAAAQHQALATSCV